MFRIRLHGIVQVDIVLTTLLTIIYLSQKTLAFHYYYSTNRVVANHPRIIRTPPSLSHSISPTTRFHTMPLTTATTLTTNMISKTPRAVVLAPLSMALTEISRTTANLLQSGPYGILTLAAVASSVVVPITQYKSLYAFTVGYGLCVAVLGCVLRSSFAVPWKLDDLSTAMSLPSVLTASTIFYGVRLTSYLLLREWTGWKPKRAFSRKEPSRLQRIPFALSLSLFYAFMVSPILYVLRRAPEWTTVQAAMASTSWQVAWLGTGLAWMGALLEAVADLHKFINKHRHSSRTSLSSTTSTFKRFTGPTGGVYSLTRHPNYTGEILFWVGNWLAGTSSLGSSVQGWISSTLGLVGIIYIMRSASNSLEQRQQESYGGQPNFEAWKAKVTAPLIPLPWSGRL